VWELVWVGREFGFGGVGWSVRVKFRMCRFVCVCAYNDLRAYTSVCIYMHLYMYMGMNICI